MNKSLCMTVSDNELQRALRHFSAEKVQEWVSHPQPRRFQPRIHVTIALGGGNTSRPVCFFFNTHV